MSKNKKFVLIKHFINFHKTNQYSFNKYIEELLEPVLYDLWSCKVSFLSNY